MMKKIIFLTLLLSNYSLADINCNDSNNIQGICTDIDQIYNLITSSKNDANYTVVNNLLNTYKSNACEMRLLLSTRKTINDISYSSLLHEAAKNNHVAVSAAIFQKASFVGDYQTYHKFAKEIANATDADNKKPIDYTTNPQLIELLTRFMNLQ